MLADDINEVAAWISGVLPANAVYLKKIAIKVRAKETRLKDTPMLLKVCMMEQTATGTDTPYFSVRQVEGGNAG